MKKSSLFKHAALMTLALLPLGATTAPEVYPTPQKMIPGKDAIQTATFNLVAPEADKTSAKLLLKKLSIQKEGLTLKMGEKNDPSVHGWEKLLPEGQTLPDKEGAYFLISTPKEILIVGNDETGTFYGVQTLLQLLEKKNGTFTLPSVTIVDWPDVDFRGTVEGFYGLPWSHKNRLSQLKFYGENKLNAYIYGPKNDPFHGFSNRWREFYPADQAKNISELARVAQENKVHFIWALHPGRDIKWGEADEQAALKKFEAMYNLGVRAFAVFFDDIGGEGAKAEGQVQFLNFLNRNFIHKKKDVAPLIMCPTQYNKSWSDPKPGTYLDILGDKLDKDIQIMWTGDSVVHDIDKQGLEWITNRIKRPAYIWWNFPVSDYIRHALMIGKTYGLESGTEKLMSGFTSNPMDKPEASKIPLCGVADFTWNQQAYDADKSWKAGIKRLFPHCSEAVQTLANHSSDPGPNGHGYRREESVEIAPLVQDVLKSIEEKKKIKNTTSAITLLKEFEKIKNAPSEIRKKANNPEFIEEIEPWLVSFEYLGNIGKSALGGVYGDHDVHSKLRTFMTTQKGLEDQEQASIDMSDAINKKTGEQYQKSIKTGSLVLMDLINKVHSTTGKDLLTELGGKEENPPVPYLSPGNHSNPQFMLDENPDTYYYCEQNQKAGDYYGLDLGAIQPIKNVRIVMGRNDGDRDAVHKGQLEYSEDGQTWKNLLPEETKGLNVTYIGDGSVKARYIRYRSTQAGFENNPNVWTAFRTFAVNKKLPLYGESNIPSLQHLQANQQKESYEIAPFYEVINLEPKQFITLVIPETPTVKEALLNFNTPKMNWATVGFSTDGKTWEKVTLSPKDEGFSALINKPVKFFRVQNTSSSKEEIKLTQFKLTKDGSNSGESISALEDKNLTTGYTVSPDKSISVEIPNESTKSITIIHRGGNIPVALKDKSGNITPLGKLNPTDNISRFNVNTKNAQELIINPKPDKSSKNSTKIYEIIWN